MPRPIWELRLERTHVLVSRVQERVRLVESAPLDTQHGAQSKSLRGGADTETASQLVE